MYVTETGMVCAVGPNAESSCAAMRAGVDGFQELPFVDNSGEPIIGGFVPDLEFGLRHEQRLAELLCQSLSDCMAKTAGMSWGSVPLIVCLAEPTAPAPLAGDGNQMIAEVEKRLGVRFSREHSQCVATGHTAGFRALQIARRLFQAGSEHCLVCGVDSLVNARTLHWLNQSWRLKTLENSDGAIPGEAAAAVLVQRSAHDADMNVHVRGLGFGQEQVNVLSQEPLLGIGLADAARAALADAKIEMHEVDFRIADVTGESYGFKEQELALQRVMFQVRESLPLWHCSDTIGDTGAAAAICQLIWSYYAFKKRYAPGPYSAQFASSVSGDRAVAIVQSVGSAEQDYIAA
ncbi:3-oxoacyl-(acyl carrier protein) synthase [Stieleria maiorica]|uniref:3-oxoacyl-(Acyl carrier protein) synthase n=1 Tax=Stieleria maiorica TaxID=2795974 RepID=A0A5B9MBA8_9BACT|nr:3-oxoacyl-ACP synthase [Stieleria maiorica]QEF98462.1 3-oxoacyl-(acyl carrier protein) synthase [Stieleria maiorica]